MRRKASRIEQIVADAARSGARTYVRVGNGTPVAEVWLEGPLLIAATCEGGDHRLGARLVSTGHLARSELERSRALAHREGASLTVALGASIRRDVLAALARDEARYALAAALAAPDKEVTAADGDPPPGSFPISVDAIDLLAETQQFLSAVRDAHGIAPSEARPIATDAPPPDMALAPEDWAILSRADGTATIARLAEECGFPGPEASLIVQRLAGLGLVAVEVADSDAAGLLAELEAAEDLAAISAAFEHAAVAAPEHEEPVIELPPLLTTEPVAVAPEPAPDEHTEGIAAVPAAEPPAAHTTDTQSLLRELSSIARQQPKNG